jgi:hypothetical protein
MPYIGTSPPANPGLLRALTQINGSITAIGMEAQLLRIAASDVDAAEVYRSLDHLLALCQRILAVLDKAGAASE